MNGLEDDEPLSFLVQPWPKADLGGKVLGTHFMTLKGSCESEGMQAVFLLLHEELRDMSSCV